MPLSWRAFVVPQRHRSYTREDHETWRQSLARTQRLLEELSQHLHPAYIQGCRELLLPWQTIPKLSQLNTALQRFGWRTVCVNGYLPSDVYAALLARGTFPVSRNIRRPEHVDFSPVPDLAHDLLGHLPMLVWADHRRFLRRLARAMFAAHGNVLDRELYVANRAMAALRCSPYCPPEELEAAEKRVQLVEQSLAQRPSALTELGRLYLWSIEFGLLGNSQAFQIYGAGLLSSPAETRALCLGRTPIEDLTLAAVERDIQFSELQSTYFVAPDYIALNQLLRQLTKRWRLRERPAARSRATRNTAARNSNTLESNTALQAPS